MSICSFLSVQFSTNVKTLAPTTPRNQALQSPNRNLGWVQHMPPPTTCVHVR